MRRLVRYTAICLATVLVVLLLYQFRLAVAALVFSLALAGAARPLITNFTSRGLPHPLSVMLVYLSGLILLGAVVVGLGSTLTAELPGLGEDLARAYEQLHPAWQDGPPWQQVLYRRLPSSESLYESIGGNGDGVLGRELLRLTQRMLAFAGLLLITVILSMYWSGDQARIERLWLSLLPPQKRAVARDIYNGIERGVGGHIRSEGAQSLLAVLALSVGFRLLDVHYPTVLALLSTLAWLVPLVGILLALPPVIASGMMSGWAIAAAAVVYMLVVFVALKYLVEPFFRQRRRFSPILTILAMLLLIESFGLLGLVLAPPLAAAVQITFSYSLGRARPNGGREDGTVVRLDNLHQEVEELRATLAEKEDETEPELLNLLGRLEGLLQTAGTRDVRLDGSASSETK